MSKTKAPTATDTDVLEAQDFEVSIPALQPGQYLEIKGNSIMHASPAKSDKGKGNGNSKVCIRFPGHSVGKKACASPCQ